MLPGRAETAGKDGIEQRTELLEDLVDVGERNVTAGEAPALKFHLIENARERSQAGRGHRGDGQKGTALGGVKAAPAEKRGKAAVECPGPRGDGACQAGGVAPGCGGK